MNKLDVAIRLLQLLNDRRSINSKIVADELNVSLRTAQRYLSELSVLPCVINLNNNHTYTLDPHYKISDALLNVTLSNHTKMQPHSSPAGKTNQVVCLICGQTRKISNDLIGLCSGNNATSSNNAFLSSNAIDKLVSIIRKKLEGKKCSYP